MLKSLLGFYAMTQHQKIEKKNKKIHQCQMPIQSFKGALKQEQSKKIHFFELQNEFFFSFILTLPTSSVHNFLILFLVQIEPFKLL
jgi:hypothetical protein